ncbi:MAG TPA: polysaccharide deacetylase family protein [Gaiellaceae bacterium]|nr:polysaccharide deacetylase family protein [Gaiellaceae bacterium]
MPVALTFDTEFPGRPTAAGVEDRLLGALAHRGVTATFFLQGRWVRANPEQARRIAAAGHRLGNHSNFHAPLNGLDDGMLRYDIRRAEETIRETTGVDPRPWFRCPFGAGMDDERVLAAIGELGYRHVGWDVDPEDWNEEHDAAEVERLVLEGVRARDADTIVLLHGWPEATAEALPRIISALVADGVQLVSVDALETRLTA